MRSYLFFILLTVICYGSHDLAQLIVLILYIAGWRPELPCLLYSPVRLLYTSHLRHDAQDDQQYEYHAQEWIEEIRHDVIVDVHGAVSYHCGLRLLLEYA